MDLVDIIFNNEFSNSDLICLDAIVIEHNQMYLNLLNDTLKPQHHFLVQFSRIIKESGPIKYLWGMRFEGKHEQLKAYAKNIQPSRNVCLSLAIKSSFKFSHLIQNSNWFETCLTFGTNSNTKYKLDIQTYFQSIIINELSLTENVYSTKTIVYKGKCYKFGMFVFKCNALHEIIECLKHKDRGYVVLNEVCTKLNSHLRSTEILNSSNRININI